MRIAQLVKEYGLDRRTIDYYSNLEPRLIPYKLEPNGKYRDYGPDAVIVVKKIIILRDAGLSEKKIKEALKDPSYFTTAKWNEHIADLRKKIDSINTMIEYAEDLRDTYSYSLRFENEFDNARESTIFTRLSAVILNKIKPYVFSQDRLLDLVDTMPNDISDVISSYYTFISNIYKKHD